MDAIDLPIARERATGLPTVPGSTVKGVLRAEATNSDLEPEWIKALFGPEKGGDTEHAGAAVFTDLHLLLFPVRSTSRLFAWVTSPYLLRRYDRARVRVGLPPVAEAALAVTFPAADTIAWVSDMEFATGGRVYLEDLDLAASPSPGVTALAQALGEVVLGTEDGALLPPRLVVVSDTLLSIFSERSTEVVARISIGPSGTAEGQALWYEESLPNETILFAEVTVDERVRRVGVQAGPAALLGALAEVRTAQLGGKASVGRGLCRLGWSRPAGGAR